MADRCHRVAADATETWIAQEHEFAIGAGQGPLGVVARAASAAPLPSRTDRPRSGARASWRGPGWPIRRRRRRPGRRRWRSSCRPAGWSEEAPRGCQRTLGECQLAGLLQDLAKVPGPRDDAAGPATDGVCVDLDRHVAPANVLSRCASPGRRSTAIRTVGGGAMVHSAGGQANRLSVGWCRSRSRLQRGRS